jgi:hypothetical protein
MNKLARVTVSLLAGLVMIVSAIALAGTATAAPSRTAAAATAAAPSARPCGRRHYPPCPPKASVSVYPHNVRRGHGVTITVKHYPAFRRITVHLAGHNRYLDLGSSKTDKRGNASFTVRIPRHIPVGRYRLAVKIGSSNHRFTINVIRG